MRKIENEILSLEWQIQKNPTNGLPSYGTLLSHVQSPAFASRTSDTTLNPCSAGKGLRAIIQSDDPEMVMKHDPVSRMVKLRVSEEPCSMEGR